MTNWARYFGQTGDDIAPKVWFVHCGACGVRYASDTDPERLLSLMRQTDWYIREADWPEIYCPVCLLARPDRIVARRSGGAGVYAGSPVPVYEAKPPHVVKIPSNLWAKLIYVAERAERIEWSVTSDVIHESTLWRGSR